LISRGKGRRAELDRDLFALQAEDAIAPDEGDGDHLARGSLILHEQIRFGDAFARRDGDELLRRTGVGRGQQQ
jgi:hypothetical protein